MAVSRCAIRVRVFRLHKDGDKGLVAFSHLDLTLTLVFSLLTSKICPFETKFCLLGLKINGPLQSTNYRRLCGYFRVTGGITHAGETTRGPVVEFQPLPAVLSSNQISSVWWSLFPPSFGYQ